jgi:thiamine-phosphate pyrophosphorylase
MATQRWPTAWLLTDERLGTELDRAMQRAAAAGAGILIRHYRSEQSLRKRLAVRVLDLGAPLAMAGDEELARAAGAVLFHNPGDMPSDLPFSLSVHDEKEARRARDRGAALVFVSPVYPTRSHPGATALGDAEALRLATIAGCPAMALGGMDQAKGSALMARGFAGWAGIDYWKG